MPRLSVIGTGYLGATHAACMAELGFEVTKLKTGFVFNNPNQTSACGCGESVELKPAEMTPEMLREREMMAEG